MKPLVSVIVPVYKTEAWLDRCLESLVRQTYDRLQILLVEDGSPDGCPQLCDRWAQRDGRIRVIHKENAGLGMARNTGLLLAEGEYLFFVDSDDTLEPRAVEHCLAAAADVVLFGRKNIASDGSVRRAPVRGPRRLFQGRQVMDDLLPGLFTYAYGTGVSVCCKMFRRGLIEAAQVQFPSEREVVSEDAFFLLELFPHVKTAAVLPEELYCYHERPGSLTHSFREDRQEKNDLFLCKALARCEELGYPAKTGHHIRARYHTNSFVAMKLILATKLEWKETYAAIRTFAEDPVLQGSLTPEALKLAAGKGKLFWKLFARRRIFLCCCLLWYSAKKGGHTWLSSESKGGPGRNGWSGTSC